MAQRGLLDGKERADLVAARTDDANDGGGHEHEHVARDNENDARAEHEQRANNERALATESIRSCGKPKRDACVARKCEREEQADLLFGQTDLREIQREDDGEKSVTKETDDASGKESDNIAVGFHC